MIERISKKNSSKGQRKAVKNCTDSWGKAGPYNGNPPWVPSDPQILLVTSTKLDNWEKPRRLN